MAENISAFDVAKYFISKDTDETVFNSKRCSFDIKGAPVQGNLMLNKLLHTAQGVYIAKYGKKLFDDTLYAYSNGPVVESVRTKYFQLLRKRDTFKDFHISPDIDHLLDQIYDLYYDTDPEEFIMISHNDVAWAESVHDEANDQRMDVMKHADDYRHLYSGVLMMFDRMDRGVATVC